MGRFSPTIQPTPSWTNGMAEGLNSLGDALMQRRAFNQQKLQQDREFALQQQTQARDNAVAGYTPAQPYGASTANTPDGLARISNAGVSDAGTPASYDPYASGQAAIWGVRNEGRMGIAELQAQTRENVARFSQQGQNDRLHFRLGAPDGSGMWQPGAQANTYNAEHAPGLLQKNDQFQRTSQMKQDGQVETHRHNVAMENKPTGGNRMSVSNGGAAASAPEMTFMRNRTAALQKTQSVPLPDPSNPNAPSILTGSVAGMSPDAANQEAKHEVNLTRMRMGVPDTLPDAPAVAPHVPRASTSVPTTPPPQGNVKTLRGGQVTDQHTQNVNTTLPSGPTASNAPDYSTAAQHYQEAEAAIKASAAPDKLQRLATLRARYNADVAKIGTPQQ